MNIQDIISFVMIICNYTEEHANIFIRVMENKVFSMLGIGVKENK